MHHAIAYCPIEATTISTAPPMLRQDLRKRLHATGYGIPGYPKHSPPDHSQHGPPGYGPPNDGHHTHSIHPRQYMHRPRSTRSVKPIPWTRTHTVEPTATMTVWTSAGYGHGNGYGSPLQ